MTAVADDPYLLTDVVAPTAAEWKRANDLLDHPYRCRCTTCRLAAELAFLIRRRDLHCDRRGADRSRKESGGRATSYTPRVRSSGG